MLKGVVSSATKTTKVKINLSTPSKGGGGSIGDK